jgi:DNA polymerase elongation subunit (family B)
MSEVMFNNVWYDSFQNKIHLWWTEDDVRKYDKFDYEHDYWVRSTTPTETKDMFGNYMTRRTCERKKDIPRSIHWKEIAEGDIKEEIKFLHNFFEKKNMNPKMDNLQVCYYDIEIAVEDIFPEAMNADYPVNAIAAHFSKTNTLHILVPKEFKYVHEYTIDINGKRIPKTYGTLDMLKTRLYQETGVKLDDIVVKVIPDELRMLEEFISLIHKHKTDVISGWNIEAFDNIYITKRLEKLGSKKSLSPVKKIYIPEKGERCSISGLSSIDYLKLYRDKFTFDNKGYYNLDNIAKIELNKSKLAYKGTIKEFYKNDWHGFCLYNCIDTLLVKALDDKKGFMNLTLLAAHQGMVPLENIIGTLTGLTGTTIDFLHKQNVVLNNKNPNPDQESFPGGYSFCIPGLYKYGVSFDITSMYPHIMVRDNLGLETVAKFDEDYEMKDIIRIDDVENKRSYFFEPTDLVKVGRVINDKMQILNIKAIDVINTDMVIIEDKDKPTWNYDMAIKAEW